MCGTQIASTIRHPNTYLEAHHPAALVGQSHFYSLFREFRHPLTFLLNDVANGALKAAFVFDLVVDHSEYSPPIIIQFEYSAMKLKILSWNSVATWVWNIPTE